MSISDIITLVSLIIAIIAILNEKNRQHLLLKFHKVDYCILLINFLLINYFAFYDSFYSREWYISLLYFSELGFKNPKNWAYVISLLTMIYIFFKIWFAYYPYSKRARVLAFYQKQVENGDISFLLDLLERDHVRDIARMIDNTKDVNTLDRPWQTQIKRKPFFKRVQKCGEEFIRFILPSSWFNRKVYARIVLWNIINNPAFIPLASNLRPYLFARIFSHFTKARRRGFPDDLVNAFLNELLTHKNFWLHKELRESDKMIQPQPEGFFGENPILGSLLTDLSVAEVNGVWTPFGEGSLRELDNERTKGYESSMFNDYSEEKLLWEYRTYWTIQFFYLLINEVITKEYRGSHFWLFYYDKIVSAILKTFDKFPPNVASKHPTVYHKFIEIIIIRVFHWLELANERNSPGMYHNILDCIGAIMHHICNNPHYGNQRTANAVEMLLTYFCNLEDNEHADALRTKFESIMKRPSSLVNETHPYYGYLETAWKNFDKIPHRNDQHKEVNKTYFQRLIDNVIVPQGLNPKQF